MTNINPPSDNRLINAHYYIGVILNSFVLLENEISYAISEYFLGDSDKVWRLMDIVLDRLTFESKRASLKAIVEKTEDSNGFIKTKNNSYACKEFFNELRLLNDQRNYFAHYFLIQGSNVAHPSNTKDVVLILTDFRDKGKDHYYTKAYSEKIVDRIQNAKQAVVRIWEGFSST